MSICGITDNEVVISRFRTTDTWKPDAKSFQAFASHQDLTKLQAEI